MAELTGADIFVQSLVDEGVDYVFGYPGGATLYIYDSLYQQDKVKHILTRHEQAAVHAADGYARSNGRCGVALVTSGPGATNAVTGIATAYMDSIPLVVFTGQVFSHLIGDDAFQEVDSIGITRPCVKHNFLVKDVRDLACTIKKAFHIATTGRPGPVVVDIPKDVTINKAEYEYPKKIDMRSYQPVTSGHAGQIRRAVDLLLSARKPMIYSGGGTVLGEASTELRELVRKLGYPITQTLMGLGAFPASDPQSLGMLGMHGTYESNMAMHGCDVLLAVGARFDDRVTGDTAKFCPDARIIHIDVDPASISKTIEVEIPIVGNVKSVLADMLQLVKSSKQDVDKAALEKWWDQINEWRGLNCMAYDRKSGLIKPQFVVETLHKLTGGDAYVTSDVGQHQMWAAQYYGFDEPRRWINSGGLGTMGFGLPAAMGVQFAHPGAQVACITGEGSIQMNIQELSTCAQYDLPIKVLCLNNRYLGMVRQWQEFFYDRRYSHSYMDSLPDFVKLAESYGHVGLRAEKPEDVEAVMKEGLAMKNRFVFMDFVTDQEENVYPMMAAGRPHNEMHLGPCTDAVDPDRELA